VVDILWGLLFWKRRWEREITDGNGIFGKKMDLSNETDKLQHRKLL
jgi:hypothetical protein